MRFERDSFINFRVTLKALFTFVDAVNDARLCNAPLFAEVCTKT